MELNSLFNETNVNANNVSTDTAVISSVLDITNAQIIGLENMTDQITIEYVNNVLQVKDNGISDIKISGVDAKKITGTITNDVKNTNTETKNLTSTSTVNLPTNSIIDGYINSLSTSKLSGTITNDIDSKNITSSNFINLANGTELSPALRFTGHTGSGMYYDTDISFSSQGVKKMNLANDGIKVYSNIQLNLNGVHESLENPLLNIGHFPDIADGIVVINTDNPLDVGNSTNKIQVNNGGFYLSSSNLVRLTIANSGDVQINGFTGAGIVHNDSSGVLSSSLIVNADVASNAGIVDTKLATISTAGKVSNSATTGSTGNIANSLVLRDASGNFTAGTITATLNGTANTANTLTTARTIGGVSFDGSANIVPKLINTTEESTDAKCYPLFITDTGISQSLQPNTNPNLRYDSLNNTLTATTFIGDLSGNATTTTTCITVPALSGDVSTDGKTNTTTIGASKVLNSMLFGSIDDTKLNQITSANKVANSATTATSNNTASAIVSRDVNGNFTANQLSITNIVHPDTTANNKISMYGQTGDNNFYGFGVNDFEVRYQAGVGGNHSFYNADNTTNSTMRFKITDLGKVYIPGLTASQAVITDGSKNLSSLQYTDANTASTIVSRNGSGDFTTNNITLSALTASELVATDASKKLTSTVSGLSPTFTALTLSGQNHFIVQQSGNQSYTTATTSKFTTYATAENSNGITRSGGDFTIATAGMHLITVSFSWASDAKSTGFRQTQIILNPAGSNTLLAQHLMSPTQTANSNIYNISTCRVLSASDIIAIYGHQTSGGNLNATGIRVCIVRLF